MPLKDLNVTKSVVISSTPSKQALHPDKEQLSLSHSEVPLPSSSFKITETWRKRMVLNSRQGSTMLKTIKSPQRSCACIGCYLPLEPAQPPPYCTATWGSVLQLQQQLLQPHGDNHSVTGLLIRQRTADTPGYLNEASPNIGPKKKHENKRDQSHHNLVLMAGARVTPQITGTLLP